MDRCGDGVGRSAKDRSSATKNIRLFPRADDNDVTWGETVRLEFLFRALCLLFSSCWLGRPPQWCRPRSYLRYGLRAGSGAGSSIRLYGPFLPPPQDAPAHCRSRPCYFCCCPGGPSDY